MQDRQRSCMEARDLAQEHLLDVRSKLRGLKALEKSITGFVRQCEESCMGGPGPDPAISFALNTFFIGPHQAPPGIKSQRSRGFMTTANAT
mgnify:CR=1 FL=1